MVAYTVTACFGRPEVLPAYVEWLAEGHVAQVRRGGALSGQVVVVDQKLGEPPSVEVRYLFPDRAALDRYLAVDAPRLRAEGADRFGPECELTFSRTTGRVAHSEPAR
ncbi:MAG: DUF4286 family protein [Phycisphaerales bacterium]|nr:DUF4286 family protein [Phycisphaerales bacterium]